MSVQAQEFGFKIGALVVLSLMIFATFNDILKID
jgi:membrane-associated protease RseP (regulator of RpoE activity)